jgi:hypothetical protein
MSAIHAIIWIKGNIVLVKFAMKIPIVLIKHAKMDFVLTAPMIQQIDYAMDKYAPQICHVPLKLVWIAFVKNAVVLNLGLFVMGMHAWEMIIAYQIIVTLPLNCLTLVFVRIAIIQFQVSIALAKAALKIPNVKLELARINNAGHVDMKMQEILAMVCNAYLMKIALIRIALITFALPAPLNPKNVMVQFAVMILIAHQDCVWMVNAVSVATLSQEIIALALFVTQIVSASLRIVTMVNAKIVD